MAAASHQWEELFIQSDTIGRKAFGRSINESGNYARGNS